MTTPVAPSRKRAPYAKSASRKADVAAATLELVDEVGHARVTVAAVAERSGIPEASVLYHFPTRWHMLLAAVELSETVRESVTIAAHEGEPLDFVDLVYFIAETGIRYPNRLRLMVSLVGEASEPDHPAHAELQERRRVELRHARELLALGQQQGHIHPDVNLDTLALHFVSCWSGLEAQWLLEPNFDFPREIAKVVRVLTRQDVMRARSVIDQIVREY